MNLTLTDPLELKEGQIAELRSHEIPALKAQIAARQGELIQRRWSINNEIASLDDLSLALEKRYWELLDGVGSLEHVTVAEVAEKLKLTKSYVYELVRTGRIAATIVGAHKRIRHEDAESFIREHQNGVDR